MQYTVVTGNGSTNLSEEVNRLIAEGWKPFGGISMVRVDTTTGNVQTVGYAFAQAMIKE